MIWVIEYREKQADGSWGERQPVGEHYLDEGVGNSRVAFLQSWASEIAPAIEYRLAPYIRLDREEPANDVEPIQDGSNREAEENYIQHLKYLNDPRGHLRDAFAMAVLGGSLARSTAPTVNCNELALACYKMADAMLEQKRENQ